VPVVAFVGIAVPDKVLTLPIVATFVISIVHFIALYRRRVPIPASQAFGAMAAAMAMQWTVARAVANGVIKDHLTFVRTAKGGTARRRVAFPAFEEAVLGGLLALGAVIVFATNWEGNQPVRVRPGGAKPSVPRRRRAGGAREFPPQRFCGVTQSQSAAC